MPQIEDVRAYWEEHPLLSYEHSGEPGSPEYFDLLAKAKREDSDKFSQKYWNFNAYHGKKILDVGCGPGYLTVEYACAGAQVTSVDLTERAVELTRRHLTYRNCKAQVQQSNAEKLPFPANSFDMVFSSGVLHHTTDTLKSFRECHRVLKPGGEAKITLYRRNLLLSKPLFPITRCLMQLARVSHPGADIAREANTVDDFIRQYDGLDNPIGIGKTNTEWGKDLAACGFNVKNSENHFFPKRFIPAGRLMPVQMHHFLDRFFGTMVYFTLAKPE